MTHDEGSFEKPERSHREFTRRDFVKTSAVFSASFALGIPIATEVAYTPSRGPEAGRMALALVVNGKKHTVAVDPRTSLLDLLREDFALTGTKKGCDRGQCGACTVLVNGRRINSCLSLALCHDGDEITTIEGLGTPAKLHPVQFAFLDSDGFQCGYCTPGQICSAVALLDEWQRGEGSVHNVARLVANEPSVEEIRERMSGNLCRCSAYPNIVAAVQAAYRLEHEG